MARWEHRFANRDAIHRGAASVPAEVDDSRLGFPESSPRLFHVDRQGADRVDSQVVEMASWACVRRVEFPPEVGVSIGGARLFLDRLLAYQRLIPGKIIESAPAIENDELPPSVGNPRGAVEVLFTPTGIDVAVPHRAGVKDADLKNVR